ncbi:hypothetical protein [Mycobacteroides abscessus]|uniref:hypothetical protein n=1 Tax=Mycobacteroides abscessus TaxID=36809 RepID=UPI0002E552BD|nr:hypothetical protein [Mycobacteroides abscessus]
MRVDPQGLAELAAKLAASALTVQGSLPADFIHPPLAPDGVSAGAALRLSSGAGVLAANMASQGADLAELASRLAAVAAAFTAQEEANAAAQASLTPAGHAASLPSTPLIRPPVNPDVRPPLAPTPPAGGEVLAMQMAAGSSSAGAAFGQSCQSAQQAARAAAQDLRQAAAWLPEVWRSTIHGASLANVFTTRAATFDTLADDAEALGRQQGEHGQGLENAQRATPTPTQFSNNRQQLAVAQQNNARSGGLHAKEVADLMAERARLEKEAITAHSNYLSDSSQATEPRPGTGTNPDPGPGGSAPQTGPDGQPLPDGTDVNSAALGDDPLAGLGLDDPALASDPAFAQMMPALLSAVVGGVGGALGSITQPLSSLPQQALSAGSSAMQQLSKGLGGDGLKTPELPDLSPPNIDPSGFGGGPSPGDTSPSGGGGDGLPPVAGAGPLTAPPSATAAAGTAAPLGGTQTGSAPGAGMGGMGGAPMGGGMGQNPGDKGKSGAQPKKVALSALANSEAITGRTEAPGEVAAAGTEPQEQQIPPPRKSKVVRVVD